MSGNKKLGRGLQDFSHLFLSTKTERESEQKAENRADNHSMKTQPAKDSYAIAIASSSRSMANSFMTFNLCVDFVQSGLEVLVLNADLSFPSIRLLDALKNSETWRQLEFSDVAETARSGWLATLMILDMDITVLHSPWPQEENPVITELTECSKQADVILVNTSTSFSANAKAIFKAADEILLIASIEPARLIETYSIVKTITQISKESSIGIAILGSQEESLKGFEKIAAAANQFLGKPLKYYGFIPFDPDIAKSIVNKMPFLKMKSDSLSIRCLQDISKKLLKTKAEQHLQSTEAKARFITKLLFTSGQAMHFDDTLMYLALFGWEGPGLPGNASIQNAPL